MSNFINFRVGLKTIGTVCFSLSTTTLQQQVYGLGWADCLTYDDEHGEEVVGTVTMKGWFQPNWDRAVKRVDQLLEAIEETVDLHRKRYDLFKVEEMDRLIRHCAQSPNKQYAYIQIRQLFLDNSQLSWKL